MSKTTITTTMTSRNSPKKNRTIVSLGVFDGVHRGHREIFRKVTARARKTGGRSVVYTFDPHPVKVVAPTAAPLMINTVDQRVSMIRETGIQKIVVQKFTLKFSHKTPAEFFREIIVRTLKASEIFVGFNFTFGIHKSGTVNHLEEFGREAGIAVHVLPSYLWKETLVSSSQVRRFLMAGDLPKANDLLARPYFLEGFVVKGRGVGGKVLGIPTANLKSENDALLPSGVYATRTRLGRRSYRSLTNIGSRPTFGPGAVSVETHLLDGFHKNIVGRRIRLEFLKKIREETRFSSPGDLAAQIRKDILSVERLTKP